MSRIPADFLQALSARVPLVELIQTCGVALKKTGHNYVGCCPFHNEKTPSFNVNPERQYYHCFGCGAHGDAIDFLGQYEKLNFKEAVEKLAARAGLPIPQGSSLPVNRYAPAYQALADAAAFYAEQLASYPAARAYLASRGISAQSIKDFQLGFAPPGWNGLLNAQGTHEEQQAQLLMVGLIVRHTSGRLYDRFRERIMFPIRDRRGRVIGFGGRAMGDVQPKYLNSPESPLFHKGDCLYGVHEMHAARASADTVLVVEGYVDVVTLHQAGFSSVVATLGTAVTRTHLEQLFREKPDITFCFDGDDAGRHAAWLACTLILPLMEDGRQAHFLFLPEKEDPDSYIRRQGAAAFRQSLKATIPLSAFLFESLGRQTPLTSIDSCARFVKIARPLLDQLPRGVFREMMFERLSQLTRLQRPTRWTPRDKAGPNVPVALSQPAQRALTLLRHCPALVATLADVGWLSRVQASGIERLISAIAFLQSEPTTEAIAAHFSDVAPLPPGGLYAELSPEGLRAELLGALQSLARLGKQQLAQKLLAKTQTSTGLSAVEKDYLKQLLQSLENKC